jgi:polyferredoxin
MAIIPVIILLERFFCGWMCAFGTFSDILYSISKRIFKVSFKMNEKTDKALKSLKFVILGFIVLVIWSFNISSLNAVNPWNAFGVLATLNKVPDFSYAFSELKIGTFILLAVAAASLFVERFFCRYLCPMGAVLAVVSNLRILKIKKPLINAVHVEHVQRTVRWEYLYSVLIRLVPENVSIVISVLQYVRVKT